MANEIEEFILGEQPVEVVPLWQTHDWTVREVRFAQQYLQHGVIIRAYRECDDEFAEAKPGAASLGGARMLAQPFMRDYIAYIRETMRERLKVTKDNVIEELAKLAYSNQADFIVISKDGVPTTDLSGLTREQLAALQECEIHTYMDGKGDNAREVKSVKLKLAPKTPALELLGKHLKLFTDVVESSGLIDIAEQMREARLERTQRRLEAQQKDDDSDDTSD